MLDEFIKELEELLHSAPYTAVDILPLVNKYTDGKNDSQVDVIRRGICSLLVQLTDEKLIDDGSNYNFQLLTRMSGQYQHDPIIIRSRKKFEDEYKIKNTPNAPQQQFFHFETHGAGSPIAGHDLKINELKVNEEEKKSEKPRWLTLAFYKEELVKHWFKLFLVAVGVFLYKMIETYTAKDKQLDKQEQKQTPALTDTTSKKDSVGQ